MQSWLVTTVAFGLLLGCQQKSDPGKAAEASVPASAAPSATAPSAEELQATPSADSMTLPAGLGKMKIPEDNPQSDAKIALGHQLFFDKRLSGDKSLACYSCHLNEDGTGGKDPLAIGAGGKKLPRHAPILYNVGYLPKLYWDGRSATLEEQASAALAGGNMGLGKDGLEKKAAELATIPGYGKAFDTAFPGKGATAETLSRALASYMRTIVCDDTDYDRYARGAKDALNPEQKRGLELFMGKAGCVACHTPPFFSSAYLTREGTYFNVGVGFADKKMDEVDAGRKKVTNSDADFGAFKVPSLRNITKSPPYFHDGSHPTLEGAVRFMASGGFKNEHLTPLMTDKKLDDGELKSLISFLGALECKTALKEPKLP
ncbi:MAG TPA: cytochrome c peroxidase [Polyangiaceae bacterium]